MERYHRIFFQICYNVDKQGIRKKDKDKECGLTWNERNKNCKTFFGLSIKKTRIDTNQEVRGKRNENEREEDRVKEKKRLKRGK